MQGDQRQRLPRDFLNALLVLATIVGTYFGALALKAVWAFWLLVTVSALYAGARWVMPKARQQLTRLKTLVAEGQKTPQLLKTAAKLTAQLEDLKQEMSVADSRSRIQFELGVSAGRKRAIGELSAAMSLAKIKPLAMQSDGDGLVFAAQMESGELPPIGSLWFLRVKGIGTVKAVLRVVDVDEEQKVLLKVDQVQDDVFFESLRIRAITDSDPPISLELRQREFESLYELEVEG